MAISGRPRALYQRIADRIRDEIVEGTLGPGARLPTEAEIAMEWDTTRSTAVQGLRVLINEGLIFSDRPRGHFVRARKPMVYRPQSEFRKRPLSPEMDNFLAQMAQEGREARQDIEVAVVSPSREVRERLRLTEDEPVVVRRRVRVIDNVPFNTNDSHFPLRLVQDSEIMRPADIPRGANVVLAELGYEQVRALDEIQVRMPTPAEADRLQLAPGTPVAVHLCTGYTQDGTPVRVVTNILPGDRHVITFERHKPPLDFPEPTIRPATAQDLDTVVELWEHAASWLRTRGIDQWQYPPRLERIKANIAQGECWIVEDGDVPIATITVDEHADGDFWRPDEAAEPALYVHRMVVRRDAGGSELGSSMLDWASQRASSQDKRWLRLDAWRDNRDLYAYYSERGFDHIRTVDLDKRRSGVLFQRAAGLVRNVGPKLALKTATPVEPM
ncbi:GNAT family N-acetyltransferase [Embleya hyalina]|uniref:GntR family transcriptional regulator n=1 Tax=Embleya hyalina TaxID=516124 RepID=A0A401YYK8_9ACTN|nr:GNAT family N-acetyltransferase [Embleya hyalina]GCD99726.1 GntR family transcriptional regulator [Embleya hyalina]